MWFVCLRSSSEDCLVLISCGLYDLLRGILLLLPDLMLEEVMDKLIQPEALIVLVNHSSPLIQQGVMKVGSVSDFGVAIIVKLVHEMTTKFLTRPMLFCFFFLVAGCLLQQSRQGTDGEIPEEPRLLTAGQSVVHPPGKPGAPRVFPGDALRATCGPGGRVSPGILAFCQTCESNNSPTALWYDGKSFLLCVCFTAVLLFSLPFQPGPGGNGKNPRLQEALYHPSAGSHRELPLRELLGAQHSVHAAAAPERLPQAGRHPVRPRASLRSLQHPFHPQRHGEWVRLPEQEGDSFEHFHGLMGFCPCLWAMNEMTNPLTVVWAAECQCWISCLSYSLFLLFYCSIPLNDYKLLVCDIQQLLVAVTIHSCSSSGPQYFRIIEDLVTLLGFMQTSKMHRTQGEYWMSETHTHTKKKTSVKSLSKI